MTIVKTVCPRCNSGWAEKRGTRGKTARLHCLDCGKWYGVEISPRDMYVPRVVCIDIETLPMWIRAWDLKPHFYNYKNIIEGKNTCLLSWSAKTLFSPEADGMVLTPDEARKRDDSRIAEGLWNVLHNADIVIGHNAQRFDIRKINARLVYHGFPPPSAYKLIDTWKSIGSKVDPDALSQGGLARYYSLNTKPDTDFEWWIKCDEGNKEYLSKMLEYNKADVQTLEDIYVLFRAWMPQHPNMNMYVTTDEAVCRVCGSKDLLIEGTYRTDANTYTAFRCQNPTCRAIGRGTFSTLEKTKRKNSLRPIA